MSSRTPINPLRKRAIVALNGRIHGPLNTQARNSERPYYPLLEGTEAACYTTVIDGSVAFTVMDVDSTMNALIHHNDASDTDGSGDNNHVMAVDCLNGLGEGKKTPDAVARNIVVLGIVERRSTGEFFNIVRQGHLSVINTGPDTIYNGDDVMIHLPKTNEVDLRAPIRLQLVPFDRELHSPSPKPVYKCLQAMMDKKPAAATYLPAYQNLCNNFLDASIDLALIVFANIDPTEKPLIDKSGDGQLVAFAKVFDTPSFKRRLIERLFVVNSDEQLWLEEPIGSTPAANSDLNRRQAKAAGRFMSANLDLQADVERLMVGKAHSTALPGQAMMLQVRK